ncbi:hypothetical protein AB0D49_25215 [Streptomyces sp. NPDC048290]|uniref:hypothetical protein n=1 Tax=Streptomyces sp. NPDC048290 TaxID=3155811 RepID=UPI00343A80B0
MVDLLWEDVSCFFDPDVVGSLPDGRAPDASVEDWQAVLDLAAEKGWKCRYFEGETVFPVPRAKAVLSRPADAECPRLWVWPDAEVMAVFRFHAADEIDFDSDVRKLQGQGRITDCFRMRFGSSEGRRCQPRPGGGWWPRWSPL